MARRFRPVLLAQLFAGSIAGTAAAQEVAQPDSAKADTVAAPVGGDGRPQAGGAAALPVRATSPPPSPTPSRRPGTCWWAGSTTGTRSSSWPTAWSWAHQAGRHRASWTPGPGSSCSSARTPPSRSRRVCRSGPNGDLTEAYVIAERPDWRAADHWIQFKLGKMWTIMGYEVIDDVLDPNLDVGNQFVYLENFTNTGLGVDFKFGPKVDVQLRFINGWDVVRGQQQRAVVHGPPGLTPSTAVTIGLLGYVGRRAGGQQQTTCATGSRGWAPSSWERRPRWWPSLTAARKRACCRIRTRTRPGGAVGSGWSRRSRPPSTWRCGATTWMTRTGSGPRACWATPRPTARKFGSVTATLNIHVFPKATIRPEFRHRLLQPRRLRRGGRSRRARSRRSASGCRTYAFWNA